MSMHRTLLWANYVVINSVWSSRPLVAGGDY